MNAALFGVAAKRKLFIALLAVTLTGVNESAASVLPGVVTAVRALDETQRRIVVLAVGGRFSGVVEQGRATAGALLLVLTIGAVLMTVADVRLQKAAAGGARAERTVRARARTAVTVLKFPSSYGVKGLLRVHHCDPGSRRRRRRDATWERIRDEERKA